MTNERSTTSPTPAAPAERKPYQKPSVEKVKLRVKDDVMAICRTSTSATPGTGCKVTPCFS
jgi:hypothetical protein